MQRVINVVLAAGMLASLAFTLVGLRGGARADTRQRPNVPASFNPTVDQPRVGAGTYIDPLASVIGDVRLGRRVMVAPFASVRGDEGQPIRIGSRTNIQDGAVLHALETLDGGEVVEKNLVEHNGKKDALYIGDEVSLAHQSQVHGPAKVGDRTVVGMQAFVFRAVIGEGVVVESAAKVIGVTIAPGRYVPAGSVITTQSQADALPLITADYPYRTLNDGGIRVNTQLADGYSSNGRTELAEASGPADPKSATDAKSADERAASARPALATPKPTGIEAKPGVAVATPAPKPATPKPTPGH